MLQSKAELFAIALSENKFLYVNLSSYKVNC